MLLITSGVHQIVHGDKVKPHTELIPEQPPATSGKQHDKQTNPDCTQQRLCQRCCQEAAAGTAAGKGHRRTGIEQKAQVIHQTNPVQAEQFSAHVGIGQMGPIRRCGLEKTPATMPTR
jgi:hypothetical protein